MTTPSMRWAAYSAARTSAASVRATGRVNAMAFGDLSDAEVDHLLTTFTKLIANLEAAPTRDDASGRDA